MSKLEPRRQVCGGHGQGTHAALQRRSVRAQARGNVSGQEREKVGHRLSRYTPSDPCLLKCGPPLYVLLRHNRSPSRQVLS